jgi:hypothetical protein
VDEWGSGSKQRPSALIGGINSKPGSHDDFLAFWLLNLSDEGPDAQKAPV